VRDGKCVPFLTHTLSFSPLPPPCVAMRRIEVDETYSSDDVTEMVDNLGEIIAADTVRDLQRAAHTTVVFLPSSSL